MHDAAGGRQPEPELARPPASNYANNPIDVVPCLTAFLSGLLSPAAGSTVASIESPTPDLLIHLALFIKLKLIYATVLSIKAKADHAQQVATSALNVASAANTQTYAQATAALLKPPPTPPTSKPRAPAAPETPAAPQTPSSKPKKNPATSPTPSELPAPAAAYSSAQRRLFAPLGSPQRIPNGSILLQTLPAILANLLLEKKLPREAAIFTATINDNGTVSLTAPKGYAAGYYAPYYDQLAKATQHHIAPENNSYEAFRPAPTSDSLLIN